MSKNSFKIELSEDAEKDFDASIEYYLNISNQLALNFLNCIDGAFNMIVENPNTFPKVYNDIRKFVVKKFPFVIYYRINQSNIQIIAVFHTGRNPEFIKKR